MRTEAQQGQNRRCFIKTCLRLAAGGGLLITGVTLGSRDKRVDTTGDDCILSIPCKGCNKFNRCRLSRAQEIKASAKGDGGNRAES